uniref:Uncharacterized protein n=1 Tax=Anguilla anguilla TaxID=7936 RepID=A0A0E9U0A9_ANGAN
MRISRAIRQVSNNPQSAGSLRYSTGPLLKFR